MKSVSNYFRLMRFDKPSGIYLLWFPTAWAFWLCWQGPPSIRLLALFLLGTIVMRAAGCVMNDIIDRNIDGHVERTAKRPLASGDVSLIGAFTTLFLLLLMAFLILLLLPADCFLLAVMAVLIAGIYPFCKRYIEAPQAVLGIAFSMGIPLVYCASQQPMNGTVLILFLLNFLWIVSYDTMYAMADRADDLKIGVKSSAILFGTMDRWVITGLLAVMHGLWLVIYVTNELPKVFFAYWSLGLLVLGYQLYLIFDRNPERCFKAFQISSVYGLAMWFSLEAVF